MLVNVRFQSTLWLAICMKPVPGPGQGFSPLKGTTKISPCPKTIVVINTHQVWLFLAAGFSDNGLLARLLPHYRVVNLPDFTSFILITKLHHPQPSCLDEEQSTSLACASAFTQCLLSLCSLNSTKDGGQGSRVPTVIGLKELDFQENRKMVPSRVEM